jgi:MoxR-like ATPase
MSNSEKINQLISSLNSVVVGSPETVRLLVCSFVAGGHALIEDRPGVGKTALAKALANSLKLDFNRVQFTSDLMPSDVIGSMIWKPQNGELEFRRGPIFTNILLGDELNRASPRVQSALLEAMNEAHISVDGVTHPLDTPFFLVATQNPYDDSGCHPLPDAQLDRFMVRLEMGYPDTNTEVNLLSVRLKENPLDKIDSIINKNDVLSIRSSIDDIKMDDKLLKWLVNFAQLSREDEDCNHGLSPRALLQMCSIARSLAMSESRNWVEPDDLERLLVPVFAHRLSASNHHSYSSKIDHQIAFVYKWLDNCPLPI